MYTAGISISDLAGNVTTDTININMMAVVTDTTPPVVTYTTNVTGSVITPIDITSYGSGFAANDARVYCILNVTDDYDGMIPLSSVVVLFKDVYDTTVTTITTEGDYTVNFTVQDAAHNTYTHAFTFHVNDPAVATPPEIRFTSNLTLPAFTATVSLSVDYGSGSGVFTKADVLSRFVTNVVDNIDGTIVITTGNVALQNSVPATISVISAPGTYTATISVTDTSSLTTTKTITLTVTS
jgi:hypothetical protein